MGKDDANGPTFFFSFRTFFFFFQKVSDDESCAARLFRLTFFSSSFSTLFPVVVAREREGKLITICPRLAEYLLSHRVRSPEAQRELPCRQAPENETKGAQLVHI